MSDIIFLPNTGGGSITGPRALPTCVAGQRYTHRFARSCIRILPLMVGWGRSKSNTWWDPIRSQARATHEFFILCPPLPDCNLSLIGRTIAARGTPCLTPIHIPPHPARPPYWIATKAELQGQLFPARPALDDYVLVHHAVERTVAKWQTFPADIA